MAAGKIQAVSESGTEKPYHQGAMHMTSPAYKRVLLKLSGEALMGDDAYGINRATIPIV